jgi:RNA polymerase sigma factor (sigma-70 family)
MNPDENISLLIEKCKQNNQEAQFEIYKKFYKNMFNTAFRILNNKEEAEDIMQECFLKAFTELHALDNNKAFAGWLKQLVIRSCLNAIQKNKKNNFLSYDDEPQITPSVDPVFETENLDYDLRLKISQSIQNIKSNYRVAISLHYMEGYDLEEISEILNITYGNCRTLLTRAKAALKQKITDYEKST